MATVPEPQPQPNRQIVNTKHGIFWLRVISTVTRARPGVCESASLMFYRYAKLVNEGHDIVDVEGNATRFSTLECVAASYIISSKLLDASVNMQHLQTLVVVLELYLNDCKYESKYAEILKKIKKNCGLEQDIGLGAPADATPRVNLRAKAKALSVFTDSLLASRYVSKLITLERLQDAKSRILRAEKFIVGMLNFFTMDNYVPKVAYHYLTNVVFMLFEGPIGQESCRGSTLVKLQKDYYDDDNRGFDNNRGFDISIVGCDECDGNKKIVECFLNRAWNHMCDLFMVAAPVESYPSLLAATSLWLTFRSLGCEMPNQIYDLLAVVPENVYDLLAALEQTLQSDDLECHAAVSGDHTPVQGPTDDE